LGLMKLTEDGHDGVVRGVGGDGWKGVVVDRGHISQRSREISAPGQKVYGTPTFFL
jgi:hypothetical protein